MGEVERQPQGIAADIYYPEKEGDAVVLRVAINAIGIQRLEMQLRALKHLREKEGVKAQMWSWFGMALDNETTGNAEREAPVTGLTD